MTPREIVELAAAKADEKKADDITIFHLEGQSTVADWTLVCSGQTNVKVRAIADFVDNELMKAGLTRYGVEGLQDGLWILLDYGTVIIHVLRQEEREFYNLERLWGQLPSEKYAPPETAEKA